MRSFFYFILFFTLFFLACNNNKEQKEKALYIYNIAYQHYLNNNLDSTFALLDSLQQNYPNINQTNYLARTLKQSIQKDKSMESIDSLSQIINQYKIQKIILENNNGKANEIQLIESRIDSLEKQKQPFRKIYNDIISIELTECKQCVTYMRNRYK